MNNSKICVFKKQLDMLTDEEQLLVEQYISLAYARRIPQLEITKTLNSAGMIFSRQVFGRHIGETCVCYR